MCIFVVQIPLVNDTTFSEDFRVLQSNSEWSFLVLEGSGENVTGKFGDW